MSWQLRLFIPTPHESGSWNLLSELVLTQGDQNTKQDLKKGGGGGKRKKTEKEIVRLTDYMEVSCPHD
jgi:hypothetical protein